MAEEDHRLVIGDLFETLPRWSEPLDLIIADPPFNIGFDKSSHEYGSSQYKLYSDNMTDEGYYDFTRRWIETCHGALAPHGTMYVVSGWTNLHHILSAVHASPFHLLNHIVWRYTWGVYTKRRFVTSHYHVLLLVKDPKVYKFNRLERYQEDVWDEGADPDDEVDPEPMAGEERWADGDVWFFPEYNRGNDPDRIKGHPCQLPVKLLRKMILTSSDEGDLVGDVFSGSGGTILASRQTGRRVVGFEIDPDYEEVIKRKALWDHPVERRGV
jgi:site-specific DNA-methyltransferase (adenine-specific)